MIDVIAKKRFQLRLLCPCADKHTQRHTAPSLKFPGFRKPAAWSRGCVSPSRDNTERADYCLIVIPLLKECSEKYEGRVKMCVKASVRWYPQSSGLFLRIYAPPESTFTATDKPALADWADNINIVCLALSHGRTAQSDFSLLWTPLLCPGYILPFLGLVQTHFKVSFKVVLHQPAQ